MVQNFRNKGSKEETCHDEQDSEHFFIIKNSHYTTITMHQIYTFFLQKININFHICRGGQFQPVADLPDDFDLRTGCDLAGNREIQCGAGTPIEKIRIDFTGDRGHCDRRLSSQNRSKKQCRQRNKPFIHHKNLSSC